MFADSYPLLDLFWTMLWFFLFIAYIWILIAIFSDIFRSHDLGGGSKTLWTLFVLIIPLIGILVYLIARGGSMQERSQAQAQAQQQKLDSYIKETAGTGTSAADELSKLADLKASGAITEAEFESQKAKVLG